VLAVHTFDSPIGPLTVGLRGSAADAERGGGHVCLLHFGADGPDVDRFLERWYADLPRRRAPLPFVGGVLDRYFGGETSAIDSLAVELKGTPFQQTVWTALRHIPCGTTISYAELARRIGEPSAVRAVGTANGANPVAVIVPCHRVIGSNGTLTGYGGGLDRKAWLLTHEGVLARHLF
jgi:methylated-DNA-[protein]-cysteine S-methyltransferase